MITVKLYGLLRLDSGVKVRQLEAETVRDVLRAMEGCGISRRALEGCVVFVNGSNAESRSRLADGDTVVLMSPVAGG